jgi:hypothetical protein
MTVATLSSAEELAPHVHSALRAWFLTEDTDDNFLAGLLLVQEQRRSLHEAPDAPVSTSPTARRLATNQILLEAIEELESQDPTGAKVLRLRFADDNTLIMVAHRLNMSEHTVSRRQRASIGRLAEIHYEREMLARQALIQAIEAQLPPPSYSRLFGVEEAGERLLDHLTDTDGPSVMAIVGIGGIGKTALADNMVRQIISQLQFDNVLWLRSEPQTMSGRQGSPQLTYESLMGLLADGLGLENTPGQQLTLIRQVLKERPHLVVIDNLESDADTAYLLDQLNDLAQPSKFLLTTRTRPASQAAVYHFAVGELSEAGAAALLKHHAQEIGIQAADTLQEPDVQAIYQVSGGNPLALKLVVSLLDLLSLPQVLEGLSSSRSGPIENLYRHIYWQSWQILSPEAKSLLQAMPLVSETGGLPDYLQSISGLDPERFWPALHELRNRSLLEVRGTIQEKRYGVHRLTETFLRTEIIDWPEEDSGE